MLVNNLDLKKLRLFFEKENSKKIIRGLSLSACLPVGAYHGSPRTTIPFIPITLSFSLGTNHI